MRTTTWLTALTTLTLWAGSTSAQIRVINSNAVSGILGRLQEMDFENLPTGELQNPITLEGVTFQDIFILLSEFCSSPTCKPDPDNANGGNIGLLLNPGGTISFAQPPREVVLDVQGIGGNPFSVVITDGGGRTEIVAGQGILLGVGLLGVASRSGIASVEVQSVGGTGGPLGLARVLFTQPH